MDDEAQVMEDEAQVMEDEAQVMDDQAQVTDDEARLMRGTGRLGSRAGAPPVSRFLARAFPCFSVAVAALLLAAGHSAAQWVEAPGEGWVDVTLYHLDTRDAYGIDGEVREFFAGGHAVSTSAFVTLAGGILPGLDGWIQMPYHRLRYEDFARDRLRTGVGDSRFYLRTAPLRALGSDFPLAVRGGVKVPVGDFAVDAEVIPLGDGQTDWELMAEVGHSFYPAAAYVSGWVGYRWRERNDRSLQDFGDERFFLAQFGGSWRSVGLQLVLEGWDGKTPVVEGIPVPNSSRRMLQLTPTVGYPLGSGQLEAGGRFPVTGKNLPAGAALVLGYFTGWSL